MTEPEPRIVVMTNPVAVDRTTAGAMLGMSVDSFEKFVQPEVKLIRRGRLRLVPVTELEGWARKHAKVALPQRDDKERRSDDVERRVDNPDPEA